MKPQKIPTEVRKAVGSAMTDSSLVDFWTTPHKLLGGKSPKALWKKGMKSEVLYFIKSAKSGDMA